MNIELVKSSDKDIREFFGGKMNMLKREGYYKIVMVGNEYDDIKFISSNEVIDVEVGEDDDYDYLDYGLKVFSIIEDSENEVFYFRV
jgi:hypothetical protein